MKKSNYNRRDFLKKSTATGLSLSLSSIAVTSFANTAIKDIYNIKDMATGFTQQPLPYAYNALEPVIDATTMELHYSKHAAGYAKNLADAMIAENVDASKTTLEEILGNISTYTTKMRNNAGGHYNHELFWKLMSPVVEDRQLSDKLSSAIKNDFGTLENFQQKFSDTAKAVFGSGWAWLIYTNDKKMAITSSANQDNPLMNINSVQGFPLLCLDVWEHAYYLKYQNKRIDYINAWWGIVNWKAVSQRFDYIHS